MSQEIAVERVLTVRAIRPVHSHVEKPAGQFPHQTDAELKAHLQEVY